MFLVIGGLSMMSHHYTLGNIKSRTVGDGQHGTARWATDKEIKQTYDIPFSRQQLADYLGVERSGLSLELGKMRDEGLLDFHKSHFLLKTPEADRPFPSAR